MDDTPLRWRSRLRRWRWALILLAIVIVVRVALPYAVRYALVSQGSKLLQAQVEVGDVDLWLLQGAVAIKEVALRVPVDPRGAGSMAAAAAPAESGKAGSHALNETASDEPGTPAPSRPAASPAAADQASATPMPPPLIAWKRLLIDLNWWPLRNKTVQFSDVELDSPRIGVDRLESGMWTYEPVLRAALEAGATSPTPNGTPFTAPETTPAETYAEGPGWQVGVDRIVLRDGHVRFQDRMLKGSEPVDVTLPTIDVNDIALSPGLYGEPSRIRVAMGVDQGSLTVDARLGLLREGIKLDGTLAAQRLPVQHGRLYIPKVGWTDLRGELDLDVHYARETNVRDELTGSITLRDVSVGVPDLKGPALAWKSLTVRLDPLDLLARRVAVADVDLQGMDLTVAAQGDDRLPLLHRRLGHGTPAAEDTGTATAHVAPSPAAAPVWQWSVAAARISDSVVHVLAPDGPLDAHLEVETENVAGQGDTPASVKIAVKSDAGGIDVAGNARIQPLGFAGTVKLVNLNMPHLVKTSGTLPPELLPSGTVSADLTVEAGIAAAESQSAPGARDVRVHGELTLADSQLVLAGGKGATIALKILDLGISELSAPGVLPASHAGSEAPPQPLSLQGTLTLTDPRVTFAGDTGASLSLKALAFGIHKLSVPGVLPPSPAAADAPAEPLRLEGTLTLTDPLVTQADGKEFSVGAKLVDLGITEVSLPGVLPAPVPPPATQPMRVALGELRLDAPVIRITRVAEGIVLPGFSVVPPQAEAHPVPSPEVPPPPAGAEAARPIEVEIGALRLAQGRVEITDRTLKPPFSGKLYPISLQARDVRWPAVAAKQLRLEVTTPVQGHLEVTGDVSPQGGTLQVNSEGVALPPYNPYAATYSPYRVTQGSLSLQSKVTFGAGHYDVANALTLHQLAIEGGADESLFEKEFGIPMSLALALMRDTKGDIGFDIPAQISAEGTELDILGIAGQALRRAIVNALASPLKLFGALAGGDQVSLVPPSIAVRPGRAEPTNDGSKRVEQLGQLLAGRPGMAVALDASVSAQDVRWLHEQALLAQWREQGFFGSLRELAQGETRKRVQQALEARANDEAAQLSAEDTAALDAWLKNVPPPTSQQLQTLATQRLATVGATLHERSGIDAARIRLGEVSDEVMDEAPVVKIQLQPLGEATAGTQPPN